MTVAILSDDRYLEHDYRAHPENAERLRAISAALAGDVVAARLTAVEPRAAADAELLAAHSPAYLAALGRAVAGGHSWLDADTYVTPASETVARLAAGGAVRAVEVVAEGAAQSAFALVRPPGHHATRSRPMGFCLFNNIAVATYAALNSQGMERVAIVDWDVHHGNGTQDIFWEDGRVLYCSTHAYDHRYFPGTGAADEIGAGAGRGATLNVPLPFGVDDSGITAAFERLILPAIRRFEPQLILVSAGYDAHWADPLGPLHITTDGYAQLAAMVYNLAHECSNGRIVCVLEGGYNSQALAACVIATLRVLAGSEDLPEDALGPAPRVRAPAIKELLASIRRSHPLFAESDW